MAELAAGARHVWRTLPLRQVVLATAVAFTVIGFNETLFFAVIDRGLHRPPSFLGVVSTVQGVGAVIGGLTAARAVRRLGDRRLVGTGAALFAAGNALVIAPSIPVVGIGVLIAGAGLSWAIVGFGTSIQQRTPAELQGRAYAAADTAITTPQTISIALGAALSTVFDYRLLLGVVSVVVAGSGAYLLTRRRD